MVSRVPTSVITIVVYQVAEYVSCIPGSKVWLAKCLPRFA